MKRCEVKDELKQTFKNHHGLKIKTHFLGGLKRFTAWDREITCKRTIGEGRRRSKREGAPSRKLIGCTLQ